MGIILDCIYLDVLRHFLTHNSYTVYILFTDHASSRTLVQYLVGEVLGQPSSEPLRLGSWLGVEYVSILVVTWLILPVVICLSQRLSHACLSISNLYSETANGSLIQL